MSLLEFIAQEWMLVALLVGLVVAFFTLETKRGGKSLSYHEVTRLLNNESAVLVDVRDSADFKKGHITGAINIPFASIGTRSAELEKLKQKQIILADKMGQHAGSAGKILRDKGFDVVRMQGGMTEWLQQNLPIVKG